MSTLFLTKRCIHCHRKFIYNPSVGDLGLKCKHCGKVQIKPEEKKKKWRKTLLQNTKSCMLNCVHKLKS